MDQCVLRNGILHFKSVRGDVIKGWQQLQTSQMASGKVAAICSRFSIMKLFFGPNYCFIHLDMHRSSY